MTALTGGAVRTIGPVPLSPAEEGLFAWLVLAWCAELPTPPALDWVDGGAGLWRPAWRGPSVRWRVVLGDTVGWARWQLPPQAGTAVGDLRADLPLPLELSAGRTHLKRRPRPGDHVLLHTSPSLRLQTRRWPVERAGSRWHITTTAESRMVQPLDDLPLVVDARVGRLSLTVAEVSALEPGSVLPLAPDTAPIITLTIDNRPIARGVLVDDDGRAAVQITQLIEDG
jgi:flagellar motor switch/type III secretory pathway protein FliN